MKFSMPIEKKNRNTIGQVEGHNCRLHSTKSQLPSEAWFTKEGKLELLPWRADLLAEAKSLSVRKDSVLAIQLVLQVGNQDEWRDEPTVEHPYGRPIADSSGLIDRLCDGALAAAIKEFGAERLISVVLHTDETSPHVHVLVAPIVDGKLNAKKWLNGSSACGALRERLHSSVNRHLACEYEKGAPGGLPHDPSLARSGVVSSGLFSKIKDKVLGVDELKTLRATSRRLGNDLQRSFSSLKRAELRAVKLAEENALAVSKLKTENLRIKELAKRKIQELSARVDSLTSEVVRLTPKKVAKDEHLQSSINDIYNKSLEVVSKASVRVLKI